MAVGIFEGYLFKATTSGNVFPNEYIAFNTWKTTPNQREEIKAYRDENTRNLTRITASGKKSVFSFETRDNLTLADKMAIQSFFTSNESDASQRKISLTYWNDEENDYKQGEFYRPNITFQIKRVDGSDILYMKVKIELIEY